MRANKSHENKSHSASNVKKSMQSGNKPTLQYPDHRPEVKSRLILQDLANNSQDVLQLMAIQEMANHSSAPQAATPTKENKTGIPDQLKTGIENLSGYSMDDVKVHYNSPKPAQINAHAYAQGTNIHLATGQERHLPHEAWHVVQQKQGRVKPTMQLKEQVNINDDTGLEKEADIMGAKAAQYSHAAANWPVIQKHATSNVVQRAADLPQNRVEGEAALIAKKAVYDSYITKLNNQVQDTNQNLTDALAAGTTWNTIYNAANGFVHWMDHSLMGLAGSSAELLRVRKWLDEGAVVNLGDDDKVHPDISIATAAGPINEEVKSVTSVEYTRVGAQITAAINQLAARASEAVNKYSVFVEVAEINNPWPYTSAANKADPGAAPEADEALTRIQSMALLYIPVGHAEYYPKITVLAASGNTYSFEFNGAAYQAV